MGWVSCLFLSCGFCPCSLSGNVSPPFLAILSTSFSLPLPSKYAPKLGTICVLDLRFVFRILTGCWALLLSPFQCKWSFALGFGSVGFCLWLDHEWYSSYHVWMLSFARQCTKHLIHIQLNPHNTLIRQVLWLSTLYRWRHSSFIKEKWSNRAKFKHTANGRPRRVLHCISVSLCKTR